MFDLSIYETIVKCASIKCFKIMDLSGGDLAHDLYLDDEVYDLKSAKKRLATLIHRHSVSTARFMQMPSVFWDHYSCKGCNDVKPVSSFRLRKDTQAEGFVLEYVNDICIECEKRKARSYHAALKDEEEYKEKNKIRAKKYADNNKDKKREYNKERRCSDEYKQYMKEWREKNKDRLRESKAKANAKWRANLSEEGKEKIRENLRRWQAKQKAA